MAILMSFRRCPYAIRARLALSFCGIAVKIVEVSLKDKPAKLFELSPKGTVPVLELDDGRVLEESLDIIEWALAQQSPDSSIFDNRFTTAMQELIVVNDQQFKPILDAYKYADRHPMPAEHYRDRSQAFLHMLEKHLEGSPYLFGERPCRADIAIFPFVRQYAAVDQVWFDQQSWHQLKGWWRRWLEHPVFVAVMKKNELIVY